jgi:HAD superfamily hydrolase (TIGR01457 family)
VSSRPEAGDRPAAEGAHPALVDAYDAVLFDLDGVLYRGSDDVPGAADAVADVRRRGARVAFVTNNSSRTLEQVAAKLTGHGIDASPDEVVTSAMATADLLASQGGGTAFVIGEAGIREALAGAGLTLAAEDAERADHVVVGVDSQVTYARLRTAVLLIQRGASLIATNADPSYPAPDGLWPGAGALLAAVTTTTGRDPDEIVGKPHPPLFRSALARTGGSRPLVVGDRLDTDIDGAAGVGWDSLMVLTGVSVEADLIGAPNLPTHLAPGLAALGRPPVSVRPAAPEDAIVVETLLDAAGLGADAVSERIPETLVAERSGEVVGTVALELFADEAGDAHHDDGAVPGRIAHLRSLAVAEGERGGRLGTLLVAHAVRLAIGLGAASVHAVTETAASFFERLGFEPTGARDSLPASILETPMVQQACSSSSAAFLWRPADART